MGGGREYPLLPPFSRIDYTKTTHGLTANGRGSIKNAFGKLGRPTLPKVWHPPLPPAPWYNMLLFHATLACLDPPTNIAANILTDCLFSHSLDSLFRDLGGIARDAGPNILFNELS